MCTYLSINLSIYNYLLTPYIPCDTMNCLSFTHQHNVTNMYSILNLHIYLWYGDFMIRPSIFYSALLTKAFVLYHTNMVFYCGVLGPLYGRSCRSLSIIASGYFTRAQTTDVTHTPTGTALRGLKLGISARLLEDICWPWWKPRRNSRSLETGILSVIALFWSYRWYIFVKLFWALTVHLVVIYAICTLEFHIIHFPMVFGVASLALGISLDRPSATKIKLTHWPLGNLNENWDMWFSNRF